MKHISLVFESRLVSASQRENSAAALTSHHSHLDFRVFISERVYHLICNSSVTSAPQKPEILNVRWCEGKKTLIQQTIDWLWKQLLISGLMAAAGSGSSLRSNTTVFMVDWTRLADIWSVSYDQYQQALIWASLPISVDQWIIQILIW